MFKSIHIPEGKTKSISVKGVVIWRAEEKQLLPPTISLDGDTLTITATDERTETFAILVDGVEVATVANEEDEEEHTTVEMQENASGGLTYTITTDKYTFENGVLTIGE